ncbi:acyloxyacyl hydrolase [Endozoicomonas sp. G2_1]|uniref:acyloxyacyl hydrolase n=1 Tax=Endozoicomonas sp. G2_1 TaxID=2821091 RepID=UPI001ADD5CF0|nr:acyloxyacyl hydrolase [Endozoicomonas sp. G2_1]MBO9491849.1 acyloxyacyl hydrolase [Endozoicomonas sp. G2_1]
MITKNTIFTFRWSRLLLLLQVGVFSVLFSFGATAQQHRAAVDYIHGEGDVEGIKLAYQYHTNWLKSWSKHVNLYFESSINFWEYGAENNHDTNFVLAISPVIEYPIAEYRHTPIYLEFGIGVSLLDDTKFAGKNVGSHYQFEDRLGIKTYFGKGNRHSLGLRYFHYSNAGLQDPNPGLDFISLSYSQAL